MKHYEKKQTKLKPGHEWFAIVNTNTNTYCMPECL